MKKVSINFTEVKLDWINFIITVGNQSFKDRFSEVYGPLINYKKWLESISIGAQQTSFNYDNEGNEIKFDFEQVTYEKCVLSITEYYNPKRVFLKESIDRKQLVSELYNSLFNFYFSTAFDSKEWETENMKTKIRAFLKVNDNYIEDIMLNLSRAQMLNLLYFSDPVHTSKTDNSKDNIESNLQKTLDSLRFN